MVERMNVDLGRPAALTTHKLKVDPNRMNWAGAGMEIQPQPKVGRLTT
jgi:hypothetical protein